MHEQLMCLQDIREAVGDREGRLMQSDLIERIRCLVRDAARYRWLRLRAVKWEIEGRRGYDTTSWVDTEAMDSCVDAAMLRATTTVEAGNGR